MSRECAWSMCRVSVSGERIFCREHETKAEIYRLWLEIQKRHAWRRP